MGTVGDKRLFVRLGEKVSHRDYLQWGEGVVGEEMTSSVPGGTCLVRIKFQDGRQRTFNNDMDHPMCCYYLGLRKVWDSGADLFEPGPLRVRRPRRLAGR